MKGFQLAAAAALIVCSNADAAFTMTISEVGVNVVATGVGTINTAALPIVGGGAVGPFTFSRAAITYIGVAGNVDTRGPVAGPVTFGTNNFPTPANSATGPIVGISGSGRVILTAGYVSQSLINSSATWNGHTFATLGLTPGTYTWTWGAGVTADSLTVVIANPQTINFAALADQVLGSSPAATANATSGLAVSFTSGTPAVCTVTPVGAITLIALGTCTINADQAGNALFLPAPQVSRSFLVSAVPVAAAPSGVPTLSEWALIGLASIMAMLGLARTRRR